jgi:mono/diheme cytochrome c family protein
MPRPSRFLVCSLVASAAFASGCGNHKINVSKDEGEPVNHGAILFNERCAGCHTLDAADAYGSKPEGKVKGGERTDGPNFNVRKETREDVLYAIRNGGFSGAIMPANIVVGADAQAIADFLSKYSGGRHPDEDLSNTGTTPGS